MALIALCGIGSGMCAAQQTKTLPDVTIAPRSSAAVSAQVIDPAKEPAISQKEKLRLIRSRIKYVFVLFQENRSFDFYFGTYPGANGLFSKPAAETPGFTQLIVNTDGPAPADFNPRPSSEPGLPTSGTWE